MAVPRRMRAHVCAQTHEVTTKRSAGVTKRTGKTITPKLVARKQQQQLQKSIQRFGTISKLATCAGKEMNHDEMCDWGKVENTRKRMKGEGNGYYSDVHDIEEETDKAIGMIRSTAALVIETKSEEEISSQLPVKKRVRFAVQNKDEDEDKPRLRSVLVTGQKQDIRKRKRVTFHDDGDNIDEDDKDDAIEPSKSPDTAMHNIHSSTCSLTSTPSKSEAIYRAGISESLQGFQSPSKRQRNTLLSSTRLLAGKRRLNELKADAADAREKAGKTEKSLPKAFSIYQEQQKLRDKENIAQPEEVADDGIDSVRVQNRNDASTRNQSLLDRILAKQQWLAALPQAPSKAERERRAALHRAEEVVGMLTLLAGRDRASGFGERQANVSPRMSFPLQVLVKSVQGSIRSPMASEEVLKCLEVLEEEVGPAGFVRIVRTSGVCAVVVCPRLRPAMSELRERVEEALAVEGKA